MTSVCVYFKFFSCTALLISKLSVVCLPVCCISRQTQELLPFLDALKAVGYATDTIEITPARMNEEVEKVAKSKFDREQRQRKPEDREVFDLSK